MNSITFSKVNEMTIDEKYFAREGSITKVCKIFSEFISCFCIDNMIFVANNRSLIIFKPK